MINKVAFRQFKGLRSVDIALSQLTVIVGPNASGKTSILEGIFNLCGSVWSKPPAWTNPYYLAFVYARGGQGDLQITGTSRDDTCSLRATPPTEFHSRDPMRNLPGNATSHWEVKSEVLEKRNNWREITDTDRLRLGAFQANLLQFDASRLALPSYSELARPHVNINGEGLAPALAYVALNQPDRFREIQDRLRQIVPGLKRIRFDKMAANKLEHEIIVVDGVEVPRDVQRSQVQDLIMFDFEDASDVPSIMVSEGTLVGLGLLTVLLGPVRPKVILMDDLERGLHPRAQKSVMRILRELIAEDADLQIVATSHSPFVVDELQPSEVLLATSNATSGTTCANLNDHPEFDRWKDEMLSGEFWSVVGEDWLNTLNGLEQRS